MTTNQPMHFEISVDDFDCDLLPERAREPGTDTFRDAVRQFYADEFADLEGDVYTEFEDDRIMVTWVPNIPIEDFSHMLWGN